MKSKLAEKLKPVPVEPIPLRRSEMAWLSGIAARRATIAKQVEDYNKQLEQVRATLDKEESEALNEIAERLGMKVEDMTSDYLITLDGLIPQKR